MRILGLSFPKVQSEHGVHLDKHLGRKRDMGGWAERGTGASRERHRKTMTWKRWLG